ncbi:MAG: DsrE family protein [Gammaproteobacteria bacterium]|nr:DsrE family protein [Gammaproteobacteria bacterium]MDH5653044.1 DsrE family protein [Gammaproteobacteria bacterium]
MKKLTKAGVMALAAFVGLGVSSVQAGTANNGYDKQKVVYHINDIHSANGALRNIKNHLNALGDGNAEIIVVTHSSGAFALVDGAMGKKDKKTGKVYNFNDQIASLANRGVKFQICGNTIRGKKIDKSKINEHAEVIPSGVAHVAHLQQKGYLYVKP